jgi:PhnB protein
MSWKPDGYSSVSPYLVVNGAQKVVDFIEATFGGEPLRRFDMPDGSIMHAEMRVGDSVVMVADTAPEWPATPTHVHVYVEEVDVVFHRALAAGGTTVQEPLQRNGDADRRGGVRDPAGTTWWISTQVQP